MRALLDAREELLFLTAFLLAATVVLMRFDGDMLDVQLWALVLVIQSITYAAAVVVSLISGMPWLSAKLVGTMGEMNEV